MKEKESNLEIRKIGVEHYNLIQFGGRSFFIPVQFHTTTYVSDNGNELSIDFEGGEGAYCLVNGIRCSQCVTYNKEKDTVSAFIEEYTMGGAGKCTLPIPVTFTFNNKVILYGGKPVLPTRHFDELASSFLSENPQLDSRIRDFLQKYPEYFGNGSERGNFPPNYVWDWIQLHESLILFETDEEYREHVGEYVNLRHVTHLEDYVFHLFKNEKLGK